MITNEQYEQAMQVINTRELALLEELKTYFETLKDSADSFSAEYTDIVNDLPVVPNGTPSNIMALIQQYSGQIQGFAYQVDHMLNSVNGNIAQLSNNVDSTL